MTSPPVRVSIGASLCLVASLATSACTGIIDGPGLEPPPDGDPAPGGDPPGGDPPGAPTPDAGNPDAAVPTVPPPAPLVECTDGPSIDRLKAWLASGEGATVPATGSMLVPVDGRYVARIQFVGAEWHVAVVWVMNQFEAQADFSAAAGFSLTYSATDDLYVQLRPGSHWSGGDKYVTRIPSTGGQLETRRFSFAPSAWTTLPELGVPSYPFTDAIKEVRGLVFVGETANTIELRGLRVDGFTPPCQ